jgi:hypothetical protein
MERERGPRRTVRCGLHGRFYDAWAAGGCPDCTSGGPASRSRLGASVSVALLVAGGLALAWWQGGLPLANTTQVEPSPGEPTRVAALPALAQPAPLEPAPASPELAALERFAGTLAAILEEGRGQPPLGLGLSVSDACANAPPAPATAEGASAHQLLGEACEQLRAALAPGSDPRVPEEARRREALDQAAARLAAARAELERAARL